MHSLRRMSGLLACGLGAAAAAGAAQVLASPATAPLPGHWTQVTGKLTNIDDVGLALGKDGVLHVLWTSGGTGTSRFGQVKRIALPKATSSVWKVYINAQAKRLDVVALLTVRGKIAYWATQVLPPRQ